VTGVLPDDLFAAETEETIEEFTSALENAESVYIKKLSLNDWQWSENPDAHQGGPYIPPLDRDSGFFPRLVEKERAPGKKPIFEGFFEIVWPQAGGEIKLARLVNYRSKGEETHLTGLVKEPFQNISPASLLLVAKQKLASGDIRFTVLVADSAGAPAEYLKDLFGIETDFLSGFFEPKVAVKESKERVLDYVEQAVVAWRAGTLQAFALAHAAIPSTAEMAAMSQAEFMKAHGLSSLNPFSLNAPGDAVMQISRDIEYRLFRDFELKARSMQLVNIILGPETGKMTVERALRAIITEFPLIDKVLLSAAQQRKSRAGKSFELHIERLLKDGGIPHEVQVVIESKKRPDFVLPSYRLYADAGRTHEQALVLSAKTTLRERWKQVLVEIKNCDLYLATVDENVAASAIVEMGQAGIRLVVPESLKTSTAAVYKDQENVISFKEFFMTDLGVRRMPLWRVGESPARDFL
jgi:hypothetical protein